MDGKIGRRNFLTILIGVIMGLFLSLFGIVGCGANKKRSGPQGFTMPYRDSNGDYATALSASQRAYGKSNVNVDSSGRVISIEGKGKNMNYFVDDTWVSSAAAGMVLSPGIHSIEWWEVNIKASNPNKQPPLYQVVPSFEVTVQ